MNYCQKTVYTHTVYKTGLDAERKSRSVITENLLSLKMKAISGQIVKRKILGLKNRDSLIQFFIITVIIIIQLNNSLT